MELFRRAFGAPLVLCLASTVSAATTKGLNQIVTPDVQPVGQLSLSLQFQHQILGNSEQAQYELGLTKRFELAASQGFKPGEGILSSELGLVQTEHYLLSTGFLGWGTEGDRPTPFLEGGYSYGAYRAVAGLQRTPDGQNTAILGCGYQASKSIVVQADYLSGTSNFTTLGFSFSPNSSLSINPAIYMANSSDHRLYPYLVISYTVTLFKD